MKITHISEFLYEYWNMELYQDAFFLHVYLIDIHWIFFLKTPYIRDMIHHNVCISSLLMVSINKTRDHKI